MLIEYPGKLICWYGLLVMNLWQLASESVKFYRIDPVGHYGLIKKISKESRCPE
jgi:hypothetical protein